MDTNLGTTGADSWRCRDHGGNGLCGDVSIDKSYFGPSITGGECVGNTIRWIGLECCGDDEAWDSAVWSGERL